MQRAKLGNSLCLSLQSAPDAIRTHDTFFRREVLYPLSYRGNAYYCTTPGARVGRLRVLGNGALREPCNLNAWKIRSEHLP